MYYLSSAIDHVSEVRDSYAFTTRNKAAALSFIKRAMKRRGQRRALVTNGLRSRGAATKEIGNVDRRESGL